ncbi:AAA family ATPase [Clostridioides difficile]|nr:AAA family ATPase [Clostridioides difficile]
MAFRKPQEYKIGGKFLIYGFTHEGKSWFGLTFPKIAAIDSEAGLAFDEGKDIEINGKKYNNLILVDTTADLDTLEENLDAIIDGEIDCDTLLIDSETKFYNTMDIGSTEIEERKARISGKNIDARSKWGRIKQINMKLQQAKITLSSQGKHIVSTAQGLEIKDDDNKLIGYKPDVHKSLPFDYDIILRFFVETDKKSKERKFFAEVLKDRTHVKKPGDIIENCTYDIWKNHFENRKGSAVGVNFSQELKQSVEGVMNKAEQSERLSKELKILIKEKSENNKENIKVIKEKMSELKIDIKNLDLENVEALESMIKFIKLL